MSVIHDYSFNKHQKFTVVKIKEYETHWVCKICIFSANIKKYYQHNKLIYITICTSIKLHQYKLCHSSINKGSKIQSKYIVS